MSAPAHAVLPATFLSPDTETPGFSMRPTSTSLVAASGAALLLLVGLAIPEWAAAQSSEGRDNPRWRNASEITFILDGGNSAASTLGLRNTLRRTGSRTQLRVEATALRTDATRITRRAVGTPDDFRVEEDRDTERSAERYSLRTRIDRTLTPRTFAFSGVGGEQNTFAGFNHRTVTSAGAGAQWGEEDVWELKVGTGLTYTVRRDVTPDPARDRSFAGLQVTMDYDRQLGEETEIEFRWVVDGNAREFSEVRGNLKQALTTTLTSRLALKTTLELLLENEPPSESIPLVAPGGNGSDETVRVPLRRMDYGLSVALVITI